MRQLLLASLVGMMLHPFASPASAQRLGHPGVPAAFDLAEHLAFEADALRYETELFFTDKHEREEVKEELKDVARDLEKLLKAIDKAHHKPSKWKKVQKRADDLEEEVDELAKEVRKAVARQNLQWNRQRFHLSHHARAHGPAARVMVVDQGPELGPALGGNHPAAPRAYAYPGAELEDRVATMQWLTHQLKRVACGR